MVATPKFVPGQQGDPLATRLAALEKTVANLANKTLYSASIRSGGITVDGGFIKVTGGGGNINMSTNGGLPFIEMDAGNPNSVAAISVNASPGLGNVSEIDISSGQYINLNSIDVVAFCNLNENSISIGTSNPVSNNLDGGFIYLTPTAAQFQVWSSGTLVNSITLGNGTTGFFGATATTKPVVTGSRGGNAALTSLLTALANLGLITNSTTT